MACVQICLFPIVVVALIAVCFHVVELISQNPRGGKPWPRGGQIPCSPPPKCSPVNTTIQQLQRYQGYIPRSNVSEEVKRVTIIVN